MHLQKATLGERRVVQTGSMSDLQQGYRMGRRKAMELHLVENTHRNDRHAGLGVQAVGSLGEPPPDLTAEQATVWSELAQSAPPGVLKAADSSVFMGLVFAVATRRQAIREHASEGCPLLATTPNGFRVPHPLVAVINKQSGLIRQLAAELGFAPSARAGLAADSITIGDAELVEFGRRLRGEA